jgi:probable HAF family extracellular repeat protein
MKKIGLVFIILFLVLGSNALAAPEYTAIYLGTLGGDRSRAHAINNQGQIVGDSYISAGGAHAFLWENGDMKNLGTLGGYESYATDINGKGQVAGYSRNPLNDIHAFIWENNVMQDIGALNGNGNSKRANSINDNGYIVGSDGNTAFLWKSANTGMQKLETLSGASEAFGINNNNQIVGFSRTASDHIHPVLWDDANNIYDLGKLDSADKDYGIAYNINNMGQVLGQSGSYSFVWNANDGMQKLEGMDVHASHSDINNNGQIVGTTTGQPRAALWENGIIKDLNNSTDLNDGWVLSYASSINDKGQIVGWGQYQKHSEEAFLLTPTTMIGNIPGCTDNDLDGYCAETNDCDDNNPAINASTVWHKDVDGDGHSDGQEILQCQQPAGYRLRSEITEIDGDCNDNDPTETDPNTTWYKDIDNDGYSDGAIVPNSCNRPTGYKLPSELTAITGDCDDSSAELGPGLTWYQDSDNDGFGDPLTSKTQCSQPVGYVLNNTDCLDSDFSVHANAKEVCNDGIDQNCTGSDLTDCPTYPQMAVNSSLDETNTSASILVTASATTGTIKKVTIFYRPIGSTGEYHKIELTPEGGQWTYTLLPGYEYYIQVEDDMGNITQSKKQKIQGAEVPTLTWWGVVALVFGLFWGLPKNGRRMRKVAI